MILVTGGTGRTGSEVVRALLARGAKVRLHARDLDKARQLFGEDVELATGDVTDALEGTDAVLLSFGDDPGRVAWETRLIDAAGDRRVVRLSTIGAAVGSRSRSGTGTDASTSTCAPRGRGGRSCSRTSTRRTCRRCCRTGSSTPRQAGQGSR